MHHPFKPKPGMPIEAARPRPLRDAEGRAAHAMAAARGADAERTEAGPTARSVLDDAGEALQPTVRSRMGAAFGHDFSQVRVHSDGRAAASAEALRAKAYTVGSHLVFAADRYAPHSGSGLRLIAHELAHVVQQSAGTGAPAGGGAAEAEAATAAAAVVDGRSAQVGLRVAPGIQCDPEDGAAGKFEPRPRFDPEKAARSAQRMVADYHGRLVDEGGGLAEIFNRSGNLYDPQKRRAAAGELGIITDLLDYGHPDGRTVTTLRIVPSRKGTVSADAHAKYSDGTEGPVEIRTLTSAPGIRAGAPATTIRPTTFADGKVTRGGLVDATRQRDVGVSQLKDAIREKAVVAAQLSAPLVERLPGGQSRQAPKGGGLATIDIPFATQVDASMIDDAMKDMAIHPDVQNIVFKYRVGSDSGTTAVRRVYGRTPTGFVGRPWNVAVAPPAQATPPLASAAAVVRQPPSAASEQARPAAPVRPAVPPTTAFGAGEDHVPNATGRSPSATAGPATRAAPKTTITIPSQGPPEPIGPNPRGEAVAGGILLALDAIHAVLDHFADKAQREAADAAWAREWGQIQEAISKTGKGVVVYIEYTRYGDSEVQVFEGIHWTSGGTDSGAPGSVRGPGSHASFARFYIPPSEEQAAISDATALEFRRQQLVKTEELYQQSAERMSTETRAGRWLRGRAGSHIDPRLAYEAKAHIVSAGEAIRQKRFVDAKRSMDLADVALDQMSAQFRAYMGPDDH